LPSLRSPVLAVRHWDLEAHRGGVVEEHRDVGVQEVRHLEVQVLPELVHRFGQEVHGPVEVLDLELLAALLEPRDPGPAPGPPSAGQLRVGSEGPLGHHGQQRPLHRRLESPFLKGLAEEPVQLQLSPQAVQQVRSTEVPGVRQIDPTRPPALLLALQVGRELLLEAGDLLQIQVVLTAKGVQDTGLGRTPLSVPLALAELHVGDIGPALALGDHFSDVHVREYTT
jgi:hypothetical protein